MVKLKRIFAVILVAAVAFSATVSTSAAGSYFQMEDFYYGVSDGEAYVHGYVGDDADMVIREYFLKYYVTSVEEYAFFENENIRTLSFYDATHLTTLGNFAFSRCTSLGYFDIPANIQEMGVSVFDSCTSLTYVRFCNGSLTNIPAQSFYGCTALSSVVFENEPTSIGNLAFAYCTSLGRIDIPDSVTSIADNAFTGSSNVVIYCTKESYAAEYAKKNSIPYVITNPDTVYIVGDADADGEINSIDVAVIQRSIVGQSVSSFDALAADVDSDGEISVLDATFVSRYLAEYENPYPIGETVIIPYSE